MAQGEGSRAGAVTGPGFVCGQCFPLQDSSGGGAGPAVCRAHSGHMLNGTQRYRAGVAPSKESILGMTVSCTSISICGSPPVNGEQGIYVLSNTAVWLLLRSKVLTGACHS